MHDTARTGTRVDLQAPRPPAGTPRARLHALAARGIRLLAGDKSRGARLIAHLCEGLSRALVEVTIFESRISDQQREMAALRQQAIDARELAAAQQVMLTQLTEQLDDAQAKIRLLVQAEPAGFDVPTTVLPNPLTGSVR